MTTIWILLGIAATVAVVAWFLLNRQHPESAAGHHDDRRVPAPGGSQPADIHSRPAGPGAEAQGVSAAGSSGFQQRHPDHEDPLDGSRRERRPETAEEQLVADPTDPAEETAARERATGEPTPDPHRQWSGERPELIDEARRLADDGAPPPASDTDH